MFFSDCFVSNGGVLFIKNCKSMKKTDQMRAPLYTILSEKKTFQKKNTLEKS